MNFNVSFSVKLTNIKDVKDVKVTSLPLPPPKCLLFLKRLLPLLEKLRLKVLKKKTMIYWNEKNENSFWNLNFSDLK